MNKPVKFGPTENRLIETMLNTIPSCHNEKDCRHYLDTMYSDGLDIEQIEAYILHTTDAGL